MEYVEHITKKSVDFAQWYTDVVRKAELADFTIPVAGCTVIRLRLRALGKTSATPLDG